MTHKFDLLSEWIRSAESTSPEDRDVRMEFWSRELAMAWSFLMDHEDHYIAYLQEKDRSEKITVESDSELRDLIAAGVGYFEYIQKKLDQLRSFRQNSYFLRA